MFFTHATRISYHTCQGILQQAASLTSKYPIGRPTNESGKNIMSTGKPFIITLSVCCLFTGELAQADVSVWLYNVTPNIAVGKSGIMSLYISTSQPIIGWGVDFNMSNPAAISITRFSPSAGWVPVNSTTDGDGLAALAFPSPIVGNNINVAIIEYQAVTAGTFTMSISASASDPGEGFALASGGLSPVTFAAPITITIKPSGACCFADGSCLNNLENLNCLLADGAYKGDASTCQGDINSDGIDDVCPCACNCDANADGFCDTADGLFISSCISNPFGSGCVKADVNCDGKIDEFDSCAAGCIITGNGNSNTCCGPSTICGACCNNGCTIESTCNGIHLAGMYCSDSQACRIIGPPASCQDLDRQCCQTIGGQALGIATVCNQTGSCCLPDGSCAELSPISCFDLGGISGNTTSCNSTTSLACTPGCCLLGNSCNEQTPAQCNNQGWSFQGNGSLCSLIGCILPPAIPAPPHDITKDRYISIDISTNVSLPVAYQVTREGGSEVKYIGCSLTGRGTRANSHYYKIHRNFASGRIPSST